MCAAVALAFGASAASCSWKTGTLVKAPTAADDGTFSSANAASGTLNMYVWIVDAATYNSTGLDAIGAKDVSTATASKTGGGGAAGLTVQTTHDDWTADQNNPVYALILTTYKSSDVEGYIANKATGNINGSGTGGSVGNLAKNLNGTGTAFSGWTVSSDIPEPTSGLLLVLGGAMLALRRRR